jgi:hypothetical protein
MTDEIKKEAKEPTKMTAFRLKKSTVEKLKSEAEKTRYSQAELVDMGLKLLFSQKRKV